MKKKIFAILLVVMLGMTSVFAAEVNFNSKGRSSSGKPVDYVGVGLDVGYPGSGLGIRWRRFADAEGKPSIYGFTGKVSQAFTLNSAKNLAIEAMADFGFVGWIFQGKPDGKNMVDQGYLELQGIVGLRMTLITDYILAPELGIGLTYTLPHRFNDGAWSVYWRFMYGIGFWFNHGDDRSLMDWYGQTTGAIGFSYSFDINNNKSDWYRAINRLEK